MTPLVSSILGFPEEKWKAWVGLDEDDEVESPGIMVVGREAPADALVLVEVAGDMAERES